MLKNTLKIFGNNFSLVWKQLLYIVVISLIIVGLAFAMALPVIDLLKTNGWFAMVSDLVESIYTSPKEVADGISEVAKSLWVILSNNFATHWVSYLLVVFVLFFISTMLINISFYALASVVEGKMTAYAKYSYTNRLVSNLGQSIGYAFFQLIYSLPFFILALVFGYFYAKLAGNIVSAVLLLPILMLIYILLKALHLTFFSGMLPSMVVDNAKACKAFSQGFGVISKNFARIFSSSIVLIIFEILAIIFFGIFTVGAGLVLIIPAIPVVNVIFSMVAYFSVTKNRYYLNENLIVNPL